MKELVIFDVDNTLVRGQSQRALLDFLFKKGEINIPSYFIVLLWFLFYKLNLVKNPQKIAEFAFKSFSGHTKEDIENIAELFIEEKLKYLLFDRALDILKRHQEEGRDILIISNAIEPLISKISKFLNVKNYICTRLVYSNNVFTGKIDGEIMYGNQKVIALRNFIQLQNIDLKDCWAYADHVTDVPFMEMVGYPNAVNPDSGLRRVSLNRGWSIHNFYK